MLPPLPIKVFNHSKPGTDVKFSCHQTYFLSLIFPLSLSIYKQSTRVLEMSVLGHTAVLILSCHSCDLNIHDGRVPFLHELMWKTGSPRGCALIDHLEREKLFEE